MFLASGPSVTLSCRSPRFRLPDLWLNLCPRNALRCLILPEAVTLNRFRIPLWVFCFGMMIRTFCLGILTVSVRGRFGLRRRASHYKCFPPDFSTEAGPDLCGFLQVVEDVKFRVFEPKSQKLDVIDHFFGFHDLGDQHQSLDEVADSDLWLSESDPSMRPARCSQIEEVIVLGDEDAAFSDRETQMPFVI